MNPRINSSKSGTDWLFALLRGLLPGLLGTLLLVSTSEAIAIEWSDLVQEIEPAGTPTIGPSAGLTPANSASAEPIPPHQRAPLSTDALAVAAGNNQFALDIYRQLSSQSSSDENLLVSPFSISAALSMTYAGARGQTAQQMADVLHFNLPDAQHHAAFGQLIGDLAAPREGYELNVANRLFGRQGLRFNPTFLDTMAGGYDAPLESLDFFNQPEAARTRINDWVEQKTNNRIQELLPRGTVHSGTALVLANAVYFDGNWKHQFNINATRDSSFTTVDGSTTEVPTMFQQQTFGYAQRENFQMLEMPYAGDDLSMVVMLPNEVDGLASLEASLTNELLAEGLDSLRSTEVQVHLPKFTFDDSFKLKEVLDDLGMTDAFEGAADFSGIFDSANFAIDDVLHKTFIDVNEEGTEAAAATAVTIGITSVISRPPPPVFRADHPFMFALRDTHSGSLLFMGRVTQPSELVAAVSAAVPEPSTAALSMAVFLCLISWKSRYRVEQK